MSVQALISRYSWYLSNPTAFQLAPDSSSVVSVPAAVAENPLSVSPAEAIPCSPAEWQAGRAAKPVTQDYSQKNPAKWISNCNLSLPSASHLGRAGNWNNNFSRNRKSKKERKRGFVGGGSQPGCGLNCGWWAQVTESLGSKVGGNDACNSQGRIAKTVENTEF